MDAWFGQCQTGLPRQHVSRASGLSVGLHWVEQIQSLGGRDINFGAETMVAFAVFTFHILNRTSSDIVAASSYPYQAVMNALDSWTTSANAALLFPSSDN